MNEKTKAYWNGFWTNSTQPAEVVAEQFGWDADLLASLIIQGKKMATCSGHVFYEIENEPIPQVGRYTIVLNSKDEPVCIIKTTKVDLVPMNKVTPEFASAEGEGDLSYEFWYEGHKKFFTEALAEYGKEFKEDMLLICERFELVDVK